MKFLKNTLAIVAFFAIGAVNARTMGTATTRPGYVSGTQPTPGYIARTQPITLPNITSNTSLMMEKQLSEQIDQMTSIIEINNNATQNFINLMQQSNVLPGKTKQEFLQAAIQIQDMLSKNALTNKNKISSARGFGLISTTRPQSKEKVGGLFKGLKVEEDLTQE